MARSLMSAIVQLKPDMDGFRKETIKGVEDTTDKAEKVLADGMGEAGKTGGKAAGDAIEKEVGKAADKSVKGFSSKMKQLEGVGTRMSMFVTAPIVAGLGASVKQASDLKEAVNANQVIFGAAATGIETWAKNTIDSIGLAQSTSLAMANQIGAQMTAQGLSQQQAADMSMKLVERARDIKSLLNASSTEEVMTAIAAGLRGESEPMRRFGVALSQAAIEAKALSMGLVTMEGDMTKVKSAELSLSKAQEAYSKSLKDNKATAVDRQQALDAVTIAEERLTKAMEGKAPKLTEAQKIEAAYALVLEQSSAAEGDYANTKDSVANAAEEQRERVKELSATMGTALLPITEKVLGVMNGLLEKFNNMSPAGQKVILVIAGLAATVGPAIIIFAKLVTAIKTIQAAMTALSVAMSANPVGLIIAAVVIAVALIYKFRKEIWAFIKAVGGWFADLGKLLAKPFQQLGGIITGVFNTALGVVKGVINGLLTYWETMINAAVKGVNLLIRGVNIANPFEDVPYVPEASLPRLARGGTVYPDGRVVHLAEGGEPEDVVPHSKRGGYVSSLTGDLSAKLDALAAAVMALAEQPRTMTVTVQGGSFNEQQLAAELDKLSRRQNAIAGRTRRPGR